MIDQIETTIRNLESERNITVLYACESGSRAWGFASPDSDYDLRFIYAHRKDWHLQLQKRDDTIDLMLPNDLDLSGWELAKTLRLFATCNLALNEWLGSPVVYWEPNSFRNELLALVPTHFNPKKGMHHYLSMAKGVAADHFDGSHIKIKKLFYILRPLFACLWIEKRITMPPTAFQKMLDDSLAPPAIIDAIAKIQKRKETAAEGFVIEVPQTVKAWIENAIDHAQAVAESIPAGIQEKPSWDPLNKLMLKWTKT
ncbi:nucleotidyltransferase domain-containing protein [Pelagicoccus sp. SDUM812005]|uniref:nucleotidyltransferase domain-containing protein n=1 Tax=Pelagicoccus sp. SDUM812005 TaxID=3041257 RepID=UPI00280DD077|nr:nucleotidyltransferase domain-containing protein [Pelagicoccus sp. SDUM812005]MDQ8183800.1 nucleotidyltransferase domain-containing protein [Pelagicoccus sp. SDUM812005]